MREFNLAAFKAHLKKMQKTSPLIWQELRGFHLIGTNKVILTLQQGDIDDEVYSVLCEFGLIRPGIKLNQSTPTELASEDKLIKYLDKPVWAAPRVSILDILDAPVGCKPEERRRYMSYWTEVRDLKVGMISDNFLGIIEPDVDIFFKNPALHMYPGASLESYYFTNQIVIAPVMRQTDNAEQASELELVLSNLKIEGDY